MIKIFGWWALWMGSFAFGLFVDNHELKGAAMGTLVFLTVVGDLLGSFYEWKAHRRKRLPKAKVLK